MDDPIKVYIELKDAVLRYIETAFGTRSLSFERDRRRLLEADGGLFQEPYIEPIEAYEVDKKLQDLDGSDLPGLSASARSAFKQLCSANLFPAGNRLYKHQQEMLKKSLDGSHCVVTTGTGSGKTEAFLLPLIAAITSEAASWSKSRPDARFLANWWDQRGTQWDADKRRECWRERRTAAVRGIILYPMNALVEDQLSRVRDAVDSDEAHAAYANC